ncbi:hypothetical protein ACWELJ_19015 [Nocardia sp. NPDC004582]
MRIAKFAATALLSVAALGVATVTAHGAPAPGISGTDRGVDYSVALAPDHSAVTTTLASGHFDLVNGAVNVIAPNGATIASMPLAYQVADRSVSVLPTVDASGTTLTVHPADPADLATPTAEQVALQNISDGSIVAGAAIGCVIGVLIGIWFFGVGAIIGCLIGGVIGAVIGGQQP